jgi:hypothetical protein
LKSGMYGLTLRFSTCSPSPLATSHQKSTHKPASGPSANRQGQRSA